MAKDDEILAELRKLNETASGIAGELAVLQQWMREQGAYPRGVRLQSDDLDSLARRIRP